MRQQFASFQIKYTNGEQQKQIQNKNTNTLLAHSQIGMGQQITSI